MALGSYDARLRHGHEELAARLEVVRTASDELVEEVPGQHEVGVRLGQRALLEDRDPRARDVLADLEGVALDRGGHERRRDPERVQQRGALRRRAERVNRATGIDALRE